MGRPDDLVLGLAPALTVEETIHFGPLTLTPASEVVDSPLKELASRYSSQRGAHDTCQAWVTCPSALRSLAPTLWSLFVFACVSYVRRREHPPNGVTFPENFHLVAATPTPHGLIFNTGHMIGLGDANHVPLRWPVDHAMQLRPRQWDKRIELACTLLGKRHDPHARNKTVIAAGMAADLASASMERRTQGIENVAPGARACILLGSALEALHCKGSPTWHTHAEVIGNVGRLKPLSTSLGLLVFSADAVGRSPRPEPGMSATRPVFVAAQLTYLRNTYAHGRTPQDDDFELPQELNRCHTMHAATLVLAVLIGDDLLASLDVVLADYATNIAQRQRAQHGFSILQLQAAYDDGHRLVECLEEAIVPAPIARSNTPVVTTSSEPVPRVTVRDALTTQERRPGRARKTKRAKRSTAQVEVISKRVLAYVNKNAGQGVEGIAKGLKTTSKILKLPIARLLEGKLVKTKGQRRGTKYFAG